MGQTQSPQLVNACLHQDFDTVKSLLHEDFDVNASVIIKKEIPTYNSFPLKYLVYDSLEYTPLRAAVEVSSYPLVQLIIENKADVHKKFVDNMPDEMTGTSEEFNRDILDIALMAIFLRGNEQMTETDEKLEILRLLFESGIQPLADQYLSNRFTDEIYKHRRELVLALNKKFIKDPKDQ